MSWDEITFGAILAFAVALLIALIFDKDPSGFA
jgi:hypothetical protein